MRKSKILARMRAGQPARTTALGHVVPAFIAFAADAGFDGIWLDMEHRTVNYPGVEMLLAMSHLYDIDIFVRPHTREKAALYRFLEDGAAGLMVPHVSTVEEVEDLVWKVKFPPVGDRGIGASNLQANYGLDIQATGQQPLVEHALRETFLFVQIETPQGLSNVEAIAAVPGLDGLFLGPSDMSLRMQHEPEDKRRTYEEAMEIIAAACKAEGKFWGAWPRSIEDMRYEARLGGHLYQYGTENSILMSGLKHNLDELNALFGDA